MNQLEIVAITEALDLLDSAINKFLNVDNEHSNAISKILHTAIFIGKNLLNNNS